MNGRNGAIARKKHRSKFDNVWQWGNPFLRKSDARFLGGASYTVLRQIVAVEFLRTFTLWQNDIIRAETDESELIRVMFLERDAIRNDEKQVQAWIARQLNTSQARVSRLLLLASFLLMGAELTNYEYVATNTYSIDESQLTKWYPSQKEIEKKMASIPRICAAGYDGCKGHTNTGKLAICYPCHVKIVADGKGMPRWAIEEETRIRRDHYHQAVNACFEDYYGTISLDEAEAYLDAA